MSDRRLTSRRAVLRASAAGAALAASAGVGSAHDKGSTDSTDDGGSDPVTESEPTPPVETGDVRTVTVETTGDQGDGIAKVERGYVVIVPEAEPGEEPTVEIEQVKQNVAFARVVDEPSI